MATPPIFWPNYLFFTDFSPDAQVLKNIPTGILSAANAETIAASLSNLDKGPIRSLWTAQEGEDYTLTGAVVTYNGKNSSSLPTNALFGYALIIQASWITTKNHIIALQYNLPTAAPA